MNQITQQKNLKTMKKVLLILLTFVAGCSGCYTKTKITIVNNSKIKIFFFQISSPKKDEICQCFSDYSNSKTFFRDGVKYDGKNHTILPNDTFMFSHPSWESVIVDCEDKKITISLFNADSLKEFTWDEMYGQEKWIKQYRLTKPELDSMNWRIVFDGK